MMENPTGLHLWSDVIHRTRQRGQRRWMKCPLQESKQKPTVEEESLAAAVYGQRSSYFSTAWLFNIQLYIKDDFIGFDTVNILTFVPLTNPTLGFSASNPCCYLIRLIFCWASSRRILHQHINGSCQPQWENVTTIQLYICHPELDLLHCNSKIFMGNKFCMVKSSVTASLHIYLVLEISHFFLLLPNVHTKNWLSLLHKWDCL